MRTPFSFQLHIFDRDIAALREWYEAFEPEDRPKVRAWLDSAVALEKADIDWESFLQITVSYDDVDDDGNLRWHSTATFTPRTMREAVAAWDAGEEYTPPSVRF